MSQLKLQTYSTITSLSNVNTPGRLSDTYCNVEHPGAVKQLKTAKFGNGFIKRKHLPD